jgi:PilZ domain
MTILNIRKHQRFAVRREAGLHMKGRTQRTGLLVELSLEGCRMSIVGAAKYEVGQALKIEIAGYGAIKTQVRWADTGMIGMRFDQPLHVADLNVLLQACRPEFANDRLVRAYGT